MVIVQIVVGPLETNCYLVREEHNPAALLLDPGAEPEVILEAVGSHEAQVQAIVLTHGHPDHAGALREVARATEAPVYLHAAEEPALRQAWPEFGLFQPALGPGLDVRHCREGDTIAFGASRLRVLHTPGHSPGGVCLVDEELAFTGDTLFAGSVGRTDLPGGDAAALNASLTRLLRELSSITLLYPGHGLASVMTQELAGNPWLVGLAAGRQLPTE